jgi:hypothetical protein
MEDVSPSMDDAIAGEAHGENQGLSQLRPFVSPPPEIL